MCSEMESLKPVSCSRFLESVDLMLEVYYFNCRSTRQLVRWQRGKDDMQNAMAKASRGLRLLTMRGQSISAVFIGASLRI